MISQHHLPLLELLQDDCDLLISMLISSADASPRMSDHRAKRLVRLLRQPRVLFDVPDGWPPLHEIAEATHLIPKDLGLLASMLEIFVLAEMPRSEAMERLRTECAEIPLFRLRGWLPRRIAAAQAQAVSQVAIRVEAAATQASGPPRLAKFGGGSSLGFRPVGGDRISLTEAVLLERAIESHEAALQAVHRCLTARGIECQQSILIDLACVMDGVPQIIEAKSISRDNETDQVRAAFAQLHDYKFRYKNEELFVGHSVGLWVILSGVPQDAWTTGFLHETGVRLIWLTESGALGGPDERYFWT